jgi:hypothetical protein
MKHSQHHPIAERTHWRLKGKSRSFELVAPLRGHRWDDIVGAPVWTISNRGEAPAPSHHAPVSVLANLYAAGIDVLP